MLIIGEKLNSSIPKTLAAMNAGDTEALIALIREQEEAGAQFLDVNTAICGAQEAERMDEIIDLILAHSECGIMIDSPSVDIILRGMERAASRPIMINSVTLTDRIDELAPVIARTGCAVVGMPVDGDGDHSTVEGRMHNIRLLIEKLRAGGVADGQIYMDIMMKAAALDSLSPRTALDTLSCMKREFPGVNTTCGLSNVSFGLPRRIQINCAALSAAVFLGLDSAILDITSPKLRLALRAAQVIAGEDEFCMEYITAIREMEE